MKIYLIRHGETTGDVEDRYGGDYDDHMTKLGKQQSKDRAEWLKGLGIEIIYHSPRIRATECAKIISDVLGVPLEEVQDLRERNSYGILTGMIKADAAAQYPDEVAKLTRTHHDVTDSEDYDEFRQRVRDALDNLSSTTQETIAIVTHGGPICCISREILKTGELGMLGDLAVLEIEAVDGKYRLLSMVDAEFERE